MSATEPDPHRRPRTAHYLGAVVIARRQITAAGKDDRPPASRHEDLGELVDALPVLLLDRTATQDTLVRIAAEAIAYAEALDTERTTT